MDTKEELQFSVNRTITYNCRTCGQPIPAGDFFIRNPEPDEPECVKCLEARDPDGYATPSACGDCGRYRFDVQFYSFGPDGGPGWKNQNGGDCCSSCYNKLHRAEAEKAWAEYDKGPWVIG